MVSTRMQTLVLEGRTSTHSPAFRIPKQLSINPHEKLTTRSPKTAKATSKSTKTGTHIRKASSRRKLTRKTSLTQKQIETLSTTISSVRQAHDSTHPQVDATLPSGEDFSCGNPFFPSVVFGEHEKFGLSKIGRADKEIRMWEEILAEHERAQPSLVPVVEQKLEETREQRKLIDESLEENYRIGYISFCSFS
jgi:hypothetical protein